ncbi:MAG: NAD(P)H-dependent oxidoreductase subunit E [Deltaproteobacteria bacterium]|nr:NAD(P)H-dependent oxidoreductase subunit E [Deltaproteobacteria bacterium]
MKKRKKRISSVKTDASAEKVERWLKGAGASFARSRSSIIPMLQSAQAALGYLSPEAMAGIARHLRVPTALVQGVASFYAQFRFQPAGKHKVTVCRGTACHVRGSGRLLDDLTLALKVTPGRTTPDGVFTLETVACFGSCALAPVLVVDGKVYGRQTPAIAKKTLNRVRRSGGAAAAHGGRP